ncbi:MAG TPA: hypothetical protein PKB08_11510, partial [Burkholderiaceae bacterium]|nr:hypothetical protein [Burkholderiaceae bacterium]
RDAKSVDKFVNNAPHNRRRPASWLAARDCPFAGQRKYRCESYTWTMHCSACRRSTCGATQGPSVWKAVDRKGA